MVGERVRLGRQLESKAQAKELNARLRADAVELDWSDVEEVGRDALLALLDGLELDTSADALGIGTMRENIQQKVGAAFKEVARKSERKTKKKRAEAGATADGPAVWEPPPAAPEPDPEPPRESTPPPPRTFLAPEPPAVLRAKLERMVVAELLGPAGGPEEEIADGSVRERYLVGMLAPRRLRVAPEEQDSTEIETGTSHEDGASDRSVEAMPSMFPSSIGLSFCVPAGTESVRLTARWGRYKRAKSETVAEGDAPKSVWKRQPMEGRIDLPLLGEATFGPLPLTDAQPEVVVQGVVHRLRDMVVGSVFLVNRQDEPTEKRDEGWLFQPEIVLEARDGSAIFCARPSHELPEAGALADDELRTMAMLYRDRVEFASGHGVAVHAEVSAEDPCRAVRLETRIVPSFEVAQQSAAGATDEAALKDLVLDMKELAETSRAALGAKLRSLPDAYKAWIERQRHRIGKPEARLEGFEKEARDALRACERTLDRIRHGLALLATNEQAAEAFRFANRAMWKQRVHSTYAEKRRRGENATIEQIDTPENRTWRTFQLAFILLNLDSITNLHHPDRSDPGKALADLLWFPTGGGKTEAYLGLAAYVLGLRRLEGEVAGRSSEHGVAVLMRYTLRLLTLQQFQRASALICACETIRREAAAAGDTRWGHEPFRIGLWVGARTTPNQTKHSAEALKKIKVPGMQQASQLGGFGSPVQLKSCPWCGRKIESGRDVQVETVQAGVGRTLTYCGDDGGRCPFSRKQAPGEGLPIIVVDEEIYRRLPAMVIATVDKFAQMPWNGAVQTLFGQVNGKCDRHGFVAPEVEDSNHQSKGALSSTKLRPHGPVRPPDLIIQDELHLISGPLGTLTGLYETAVDELCSWDVDGTRVRPKVIASTATVRRAADQVHDLFLRRVEVFPPPGLDSTDSFFARERPTTELAGRLYLGICAPGRRLKAAIIRVYVAFLSAAQRLYEEYGSHADPWMTLVGYFSSLRELAGTRRLVDDDVKSRAYRMERRGLAKRSIRPPQELTSRLGSTQIPDLLDRLEIPFDPADDEQRRQARKGGGRAKQPPLDVLLATNMVSVGVDVKRLGLMVVAGQPKTTAEYIQATSRVGRSRPGIVCTIYNWARPRDLSHYETFEHYHSTFYEHVEALSITPFAPRALDRGLTALLVSLVRLCGERFNPNESAATLLRDDPAVKRAVQAIAHRAELIEGKKGVGEEVKAQLERRLDEWLAQAKPKPGGAQLGYRTKADGVTRGLLLYPGASRWETFTCLTSLRDVEPSVSLVLQDGGLDDEKRPFGRGAR